MRRRFPAHAIIRLALLLSAIAPLPTTARGQHLFLDANGDGATSAADTLASSGPTEVAVYLRTDGNRDGSPAVCSYGADPLTIGSYTFILRSFGGSVAWGPYSDAMSFGVPFGLAADSTDFYVGLSGAVHPPGLYRLGSLAITVLSGRPVIDVVTTTPLDDVAMTSFGSACLGRELDNTLRLGIDWHGVDGLGTGRSIHAPVIDPVPALTLDEGTVLEHPVRATDADGDLIELTISSGPAFMTLVTTNRVPGTTDGRIQLAPGYASAGSHSATLRASEGDFETSVAVGIFVRDVTGPIVFAPLPDPTIPQHADTLFTLDPQNPNGGAVAISLLEAPAFATIVDSAPRRLRIAPTFHEDVGVHRIIVGMTSGGNLSARDTLAVTVTANPLPPRFSLHAGTPAVGVETRLDLEVTDPEGDAIASLTFDRSGLPPADAAVFTTSGGNRLGLLLWTPTERGTFTLTFRAEDALGFAATLSRSLTIPHKSPLLTAPARVRARPLLPVTFPVTASSPDGDPISALVLRPSATVTDGATFTVNASNTEGIYDWTPPLQGVPVEGALNHALTFQAAVNEAIAEVTTTLELSLADVATLGTQTFDLLVTNAAQAGFDPHSESPGLFVPPGSTTSWLRGLGPWITGRVAGSLRAARGGGDTEFGPGTTPDGASAVFVPRTRIFRLTRGDVTSPDYLAWPVEDGAPLTPQGGPRVEGRTLLWSVAQDVEPSARTRAWELSAGTDPVPVEVRQTAFAYGGDGPHADLAVLRYAFTNRGATALESTYVSLWADPEIGNPNDDLAGYDRALELGYVYNGQPYDAAAGLAPPALGIAWLGGASSQGDPLPCRAFQTYSTGGLFSFPLTAERSFLLAQGKELNGEFMHPGDDKLVPATTYRFDGDPVMATGWLDDWALNKRIVLSSGPMTLPPGGTAEFAVALLIGRGENHLASVTRARELAALARRLAANGFAADPWIDAPDEVALFEGQPFAIRVRAVDPDGEPVATLTADLAALPPGHTARFDADPDASGGWLRWTPGAGLAGRYRVTVTATNDRIGTRDISLHVRGPNRAPAPSAGGPYTGLVGSVLTLSAAASSDPDGDRLFCSWSFGDGRVGNGITVGHVYESVGIYAVVATITDGFDESSAKTTSTITEAGALRAWGPDEGGALRLESPRDAWCFRLEPFEGTFPASSIEIPVRLVRHDDLDRREISEVAARRGPVEDSDGNGRPDCAACFSAMDLRALFGDQTPGPASRIVTLEGAISERGAFAAPLAVTVAAPGVLHPVLAPNPVAAEGALTFRTIRAGRVRVTLHDVRGRLVRSLLDEVRPAAIHQVHVDGRDGSGRPLPSGVYFYRVQSYGGTVSGRMTILR